MALSNKQGRAVAGLLAGATTDQAAKLARVGRSTVYRWARLPEFTAALRAGQAELVGVAGPRFAALLSLALDSCAADLGNMGARGHRDARRLIMTNWTRLDEHADLLARVAALEVKAGVKR